MSKKGKRRNKDYVPGRAIGLVVLRKKRAALIAERLANPMGEEQQFGIYAACAAAMSLITSGKADKTHWAEIAVGMNTALSLAEMGIGSEYTDDVVQALDAIFRAERRGETHGKWVLDGPGLQAINRALEVLEAQLGVATLADVQLARAAWKAKIRGGHGYKAEVPA